MESPHHAKDISLINQLTQFWGTTSEGMIMGSSVAYPAMDAK